MQVNTLILGAGAAGLFAAAHAGADTLLVDHAKAPGEKIRISGGGRCNFTNLGVTPERFLSQNPHFAKSALSRYTQWDFIDRVDRADIPWHEKTLGQLFCDTSAKEIIAMLRDDLEKAGATLWLETEIGEVDHDGTHFRAVLLREDKAKTVTAKNLIVATGGKSIPKMGATGRAYEIAEHFGHVITDTRAALVPFTFSDKRFADISGVATPVRLSAGPQSFDEAMLFTHRGLSGPAVLQISSYWKEGEDIVADLVPHGGLAQSLKAERQVSGKRALSKVLGQHLPARLVEFLSNDLPLKGNLADQSDAKLEALEGHLRHWTLKPQGTEGFRTAEVTLGGVATDRLSSKTMESRDVQGLFFIGEAVDVTGWLGGYNFQWAWSSAYAAATAVAGRG
ncbi:MAG: aminoacetone oxidase family FAD-binding enzyme [Marinovum sp.]|nr:aminoacetone oxidase family FAD-binding enzyme [Marinovum sp.]